ncbi:tetratricopeptide repeat protein [Aureimonas jatrophae]|uniref:Tetratricopeptide repeat-containing protein n=1 Tax=Aureimonas jatrophae TaxID=1166073 RepID=A0A1H0F2K8_9HYPH|nr:tetratricopeptide repeat protein [Aureimonas jatrophae]MBB3950210.1 tetratricopeptide (TPR) repeat protein [Aureimonas jatrophae]SDN88793.1 Tetratricopeptide repeat-containing protein [Aureimonas jatrophae]
MSALPEPAGTRDRRAEALAARSAGDHLQALALFREAGDRWSRNDAGLELLALGRVDEAEREAVLLLREAADFAPAHRTLALVARRQGRHEEALQRFRAAAVRAPDDLWSRQDAAAELRALGRLDEAEEALRGLASATPLPHAVRELGRAARMRGDGEAALAAFRVASELRPDDPWFELDRAEALVALGRADEACERLATLAGRQPRFAGAPRLLARIARDNGDGAGEIAYWRRAAAIDPAHSLDLADALLRSNELAEAVTLAARHLVGHPRALRALQILVRAAQEAGDLDLALAHARAGWARGHGPLQAGLELAATLRAASRIAEAEALYLDLAGREDAPPEAFVELALLERRSRGIEAARTRLASALKRAPGHPRALLCLGDLLRETGEMAEAEEAYRSALLARPGFGWALAGRAQLAEARGDRANADALWREAIEAEPAESWFAVAFAARQRERGAFREALALLATVPDSSPRAPEAALGRAHVLRAQGDGPGALLAFEAAAQRWPQQAEAWVEASEAALRLGQADRALHLLTGGETACPDHPAFPEAQARHAVSRDDLGAAERYLERAEVLDGGRIWPQIARARLAAAGGRPAEARARLAAIRRRFGPRAETELAQSEIERQCGRPERAEARLRAARRRHPGHPLLAAQAVLTLVEAGRLTAAAALLPLLPGATPAECGRRHFAAAQLAAAHWDFPRAIREGEAAVRLLPTDGWVRNRLAHAALLALDTERATSVLADLAALEAGANALRGQSANPSQTHYGQLLDEFRLDADALSALRDALVRPGQERLAAIDAVVRAFPDSTAPAILRFIEARRAGALPAMLGSGDGGVPRRIHQFWTDPEPPADVSAYMESWRRRNPGFSHRLWDDASARRFIDQEAAPEVGLAFGRAREPAMRADIFRLALLAREGGVWADADDRCRRGIMPLLERGAGLICYQEDLGSLGNNWLAARPNHPVVVEALRAAAAAVNRGDSDILWLAAGPGLLTRIAAGVVAAGNPDLVVLDRAAFLDHVAIHCLAAYKSSDRHWSRTAFGGRRRPRG